ncbi:MAG: carboxypeptidase-like regulatory domain-containing protein [Gemmatimonadetes bacterium]|nr:carboxypeptidase-like regulatory domain-containing protein [Gemmatimonadota bacterium]
MKSLLVCLLGLLIAVQATPVSPPVVSGQGRLADGSPVAGAQVVLFDVADLRRGPVGQATTDAAGRFALPLVGAALVLPSEVGLGPNYPNPFNPSTIIPYQLAATSQVRLGRQTYIRSFAGTLSADAAVRGAVAGEDITVFSSWDDVTKELDLQPIQ